MRLQVNIGTEKCISFKENNIMSINKFTMADEFCEVKITKSEKKSKSKKAQWLQMESIQQKEFPIQQ